MAVCTPPLATMAGIKQAPGHDRRLAGGGSLLAVRAAYLIGQLRRVSEAFVAVLPTLEGQHEAVADMGLMQPSSWSASMPCPRRLTGCRPLGRRRSAACV